MKVISKRISIYKTDKVLSIVILPTDNKKKLGLLFLWLMAWTVCGLIVLINYFKLQEQNSKLFTIIYLSFWAYFEFSIMRVFIWKKFGREKIWVQDGELNYKREINNKGKVKSFNLDLVSKLTLIELSRSSFVDSINQSFWVKGGERLEFTSQAQTIRLGMQISDEEARQIMKELNARL
jgi:hypothetical protein